MRTKLVRVGRRPKTVIWAVIMLALAAAAYIRVSLPALCRMREESVEAVGTGERITREIVIEPLTAYLVSFGEYDVMSSARVEAARYVSRGAAGYVMQADKFEVIGAAYARKEDAEKVCEQLRAAENIECSVRSIGSPETTLRITAGSEQIAAFLTGEQTLRDSAEALGQLAFSIDRGEANAKQARMVIESHIRRVDDARKEINLQTEDSRNNMYQTLEKLLDELYEQMEEMLLETSGMALSSKLKYAYVDFRAREIEMLNNLAR